VGCPLFLCPGPLRHSRIERLATWGGIGVTAGCARCQHALGVVRRLGGGPESRTPGPFTPRLRLGGPVLLSLGPWAALGCVNAIGSRTRPRLVLTIFGCRDRGGVVSYCSRYGNALASRRPPPRLAPARSRRTIREGFNSRQQALVVTLRIGQSVALVECSVGGHEIVPCGGHVAAR
jgi:hypothetical protein